MNLFLIRIYCSFMKLMKDMFGIIIFMNGLVGLVKFSMIRLNVIRIVMQLTKNR